MSKPENELKSKAKTLHLKPGNVATVERAARLLAFYDNISLSEWFYHRCAEVVEKYDGKKP